MLLKHYISNQSWTPENDSFYKNIKQHNIEH